MAEFDTPQALLANRHSIFYGMARNAGLVNEANVTTIKEELDFIQTTEL